ncbi:hypothetical protein LUZ62_040823 [Rhynchospora pubera]|uniref:DUF4220 domain-containing protein n=1 Tax=Rhynchospora pubera TaxID=906938 RepID=A0AAV8F871_9POAL|nr:hypothetical protein LUZ62_013635 [Rhynchospora pubera]KAJ4789577.1 hypothetical protein LUZ62_040823 [Rhynchospora pubera]
MGKNQNSCTSELGLEALMVITTSIIVVTVLYAIVQGIQLTFKTISYRKLSDKNAGIILSLAYALFLPVMSYMFSQAKQNNPEGRAQVFLVWMVLFEIIRRYTPLNELRASLFVICGTSIAREILKGITIYIAKDSYVIGRNPKLIHGYMKRVLLEDELRTTPMNNCDYIVMGEENHEIAVGENGYLLGDKRTNSIGKLTIGRVFQLNSSEDETFTLAYPCWRDTCLSLALAKMLRRRFVNLPLDEAGSSKALAFVLEGLIDYIGNNKDILTEGRNRSARNPIERVFGIIQDELKFVSEFLHTKKPTIKNRCDYAMREVIWDEKSVLGRGVKLAKLLVYYADNGIEAWRMLSEFWAEMMLFISPSDNVEAHEEILEQEELITQLWALLTHAGILTRPRSTEHPNHGTESYELTEVVIV